MTIRFEIPQEIEQQVRANGMDVDQEARESYLLELYRQDRISHAQLRDALGLSFHETEALIKEHSAGHDIPVAEFGAGQEFLKKTKTP